jgi:hypothetical protein
MINLIEYEKLILTTAELLAQISDKEAGFNESAKSWSRKEILGHLIDSANVNYNRFISSLKKNDLIYSTYPQDDWVQLQDYNNREWEELIELWTNLNVHIIKLIKRIPAKVLKKKRVNHNFDKICFEVVGPEKESSVEYLIKDYYCHLEHHIKQIANY